MLHPALTRNVNHVIRKLHGNLLTGIMMDNTSRSTAENITANGTLVQIAILWLLTTVYFLVSIVMSMREQKWMINIRTLADTFMQVTNVTLATQEELQMVHLIIQHPSFL
jgi:uncharacterized membrane protein